MIDTNMFQGMTDSEVGRLYKLFHQIENKLAEEARMDLDVHTSSDYYGFDIHLEYLDGQEDNEALVRIHSINTDEIEYTLSYGSADKKMSKSINEQQLVNIVDTLLDELKQHKHIHEQNDKIVIL